MTLVLLSTNRCLFTSVLYTRDTSHLCQLDSASTVYLHESFIYYLYPYFDYLTHGSTAEQLAYLHQKRFSSILSNSKPFKPTTDDISSKTNTWPISNTEC